MRSNSNDCHYTPEFLADRLINFIPNSSFNTIADFCVGNGALLSAAKKRWPNAKLSGTDISRHVIQNIRSKYKDWELSLCDFTNSKSRSRTKVLKEKSRRFELILLNPPFSCRGGKRHKVIFDETIFYVSTSMLFVVESIKYLATNGSLYSILPNSVAYSEKDKAIWNRLVEKYGLSILEESDSKHFEECSSKVIIVSINSKVVKKNRMEMEQISKSFSGLSLFRGKTGMHTLNGHNSNGDLFVHTTNLRNNSIENLGYRINGNLSKVKGPAVLIPRVGLPNPQKICVIQKNESYVLSDCILAITTKNNADAKKLMSTLLSDWESFSDLYKGTGARYITINRLSAFLKI